MKFSKLSSYDLITIGINTAIYFVLCAIGTLLCTVVIPGFGQIMIPAVTALICGTIYMLMIAKLHKFGGISVMGTVMGLFFALSGHFPLAFIPCILFGIIADLVANISSYNNKLINLFSYIIFSFGLLGPVLPLWFMKDAYIEHLVNKGKDSAYIEKAFANISVMSFIYICLAIIICAIIGGLFGQYILKKHFEKVGIL